MVYLYFRVQLVSKLKLETPEKLQAKFSKLELLIGFKPKSSHRYFHRHSGKIAGIQSTGM